MDVKQEPFDPYEGVIKTESNFLLPVHGQTQENDWCSTKQKFKNHDFVFVDTNSICKYQESEQSINVSEIKQEMIECEVPKIEYQPWDFPTNFYYKSVCEDVEIFSTTVKKELDNKQEVSESIQTQLATYCDLPTLKNEGTDYPDYFIQSCSDKHAGKTFKTTANIYEKGRRYPCPVCHKNFRSSKSSSKHIGGHFGKSFVVCEFCGKLLTKIEFFRHYFIHLVKKQSRKKYLKSGIHQQHLIIHNNEKPFKCEICSKKFNDKSSLQLHSIIHTNEKPFKCDICSKEFNHKSSLQRHLVIHSNEKLFKCDICSKEFNHKFSFQRHLIIHTTRKSFKCDICSQKFNFNTKLQEHLKLIHIDEKPFKCDICLKKFNRKYDLNGHLLIHTDKKPFKCDICPKTFTRRSNLQEHILIHSDEKRFKCDICSKGFKRKSILQEHVIIHTDEKPFKCDMCPKEFKHKSNFRKHLIIHSKI